MSTPRSHPPLFVVSKVPILAVSALLLSAILSSDAKMPTSQTNTTFLPEPFVAEALRALSYPSGSTLTSAAGTIEVGSADYRNNVDYYWIIAPSGAATVTLTFTTFSTQSCCDRVRVYSCPDAACIPYYATEISVAPGLSGSSLPSPVTSQSGVMKVRFVTDSSTTSSGWTADWTSSKAQAVTSGRCPNSAGQISTLSSGAISVAEYEYFNNADCSWIIAPTGAMRLTLSFTDLATEANHDYVRVYSCSTTECIYPTELSSSPFSGNTAPQRMTSSTGILKVRFTTDGSRTSSGWRATWLADSRTTQNNAAAPERELACLESQASAMYGWMIVGGGIAGFIFLLARNGFTIDTGASLYSDDSKMRTYTSEGAYATYVGNATNQDKYFEQGDVNETRKSEAMRYTADIVWQEVNETIHREGCSVGQQGVFPSGADDPFNQRQTDLESQPCERQAVDFSADMQLDLDEGLEDGVDGVIAQLIVFYLMSRNNYVDLDKETKMNVARAFIVMSFLKKLAFKLILLIPLIIRKSGAAYVFVIDAVVLLYFGYHRKYCPGSMYNEIHAMVYGKKFKRIYAFDSFGFFMKSYIGFSGISTVIALVSQIQTLYCLSRYATKLPIGQALGPSDAIDLILAAIGLLNLKGAMVSSLAALLLCAGLLPRLMWYSCCMDKNSRPPISVYFSSHRGSIAFGVWKMVYESLEEGTLNDISKLCLGQYVADRAQSARLANRAPPKIKPETQTEDLGFNYASYPNSNAAASDVYHWQQPTASHDAYCRYPGGYAAPLHAESETRWHNLTSTPARAAVDSEQLPESLRLKAHDEVLAVPLDAHNMTSTFERAAAVVSEQLPKSLIAEDEVLPVSMTRDAYNLTTLASAAVDWEQLPKSLIAEDEVLPVSLDAYNTITLERPAVDWEQLPKSLIAEDEVLPVPLEAYNLTSTLLVAGAAVDSEDWEQLPKSLTADEGMLPVRLDHDAGLVWA